MYFRIQKNIIFKRLYRQYHINAHINYIEKSIFYLNIRDTPRLILTTVCVLPLKFARAFQSLLAAASAILILEHLS